MNAPLKTKIIGSTEGPQEREEVFFALLFKIQ